MKLFYILGYRNVFFEKQSFTKKRTYTSISGRIVSKLALGWIISPDSICLDRPLVLPASSDFIREWFPDKHSGIQTGKVSYRDQVRGKTTHGKLRTF